MIRFEPRESRVGVVVPVSNTNLEPDCIAMGPEGVSMHFARAGGYDLDQVPDSEQMIKFAQSTLDAIRYVSENDWGVTAIQDYLAQL